MFSLISATRVVDSYFIFSAPDFNSSWLPPFVASMNYGKKGTVNMLALQLNPSHPSPGSRRRQACFCVLRITNAGAPDGLSRTNGIS